MDPVQRPQLRLVGADERMTAERRRPDLARWLLAVLAVLQILLGLAQIAGVRVVDVVNGGHVSNESAAWNVALGAAFLGVARAGKCHPEVLAILTAFVGTLTLLAATDLLGGRVGAGRLGTHSIVIAGFLLVLRLARRSGDNRPETPPPPAGTFRPRAETNAAQTSTRNGPHAKYPHPRFPA